MSSVNVVNVVGSGELGEEVDLHVLADNLDVEAEYDPEVHTGMHIRLESGALITLYRTGSYHIVGVDSEQALFDARDEFLGVVRDVGLDVPSDDDPFAVRNFVTTTSLEEPVNLNTLAIGLGLDQTEYEPEQFPGLVYRLDEPEVVMLLFGSGKIVIAGAENVEAADRAFSKVRSELKDLDLLS